MKIAVMGYSGSGKSTLARFLGERYGAPVLHLDTVQYLPDWAQRDKEEQRRIVGDFLDSRDAWIIDGNYSALFWERRLAEADRIVLLLFPRWICLWRVWRRYRTYSGRNRPDMADGCAERLDREFVLWVLRDGRSPGHKARYRWIRDTWPEKTVLLRTRRQVEKFKEDL